MNKSIATIFILVPFLLARADPVRTTAKSNLERVVPELVEQSANLSGRTTEEEFVRFCVRVKNIAIGYDPSYDFDLKRDARWKSIQSKRAQAGFDQRPTPISEIVRWNDSDVVQSGFAALSANIAASMFSRANGDIVSSFEKLDEIGFPAPFARSIAVDVLTCHYRARWHKMPENFQDAQRMADERDKEIHRAIVRLAESQEEQDALLSRRIRALSELPVRPPVDLPPEDGRIHIWKSSRFETDRCQDVLECTRKSTRVGQSLVVWLRVARIAAAQRNTLRNCGGGKAALAVTALPPKGKRREVDVLAHNNRKLIREIADHLPFFFQHLPQSEIETHAIEFARLANLEVGEETMSFLRKVDLRVTEIKGTKEAWYGFAVRDGKRVEELEMAKIPRPADFGQFLPYQNMTPVLQEELERYGLEAGIFSHRTIGETNSLSFLLFCPKHAASAKIPLIVFLPGIGEIGENLENQFRQRTIFGTVTSSEFQKRHPCYLLAISPPAGTTTLAGYDPGGKPTSMQRAIHDLVLGIARSRKRPAIDETRIYLTGLSFGGTGAYALSFSYPGFFSAVVPVASTLFSTTRIPETIPSFIFHVYNEGDYREKKVDISQLEAFGARVRELGGDFRIGTFPNEGHNAWDAAWRDEAVWDWMFSKRRGAIGTAASALDPTRRAGREEKHAESAENAAPKPPAVTASKSGRDGRTGPERAADGLDGTAYVSASPVSAGDWLQVEWSAPVQGRIEVRTGLSDGTLRLSRGRVEVSVDGRMWSRVGTVSGKTGVCAFQQRTGIRFLRILPEPRVPEPLAVREIAVKP